MSIPQSIDRAATPPQPMMPPDARLLQLMLGLFTSRALAVAAELGIADLLKEGPLDLKDLAQRTGSNPDGLYRMLRALAAVGVFELRADRSFANNELSTLLRGDLPGTSRANALWFSDVSGWTAWGRLDHSVRTGKPAFDEVFGSDCFTWLESHPASLKVFQQTMTNLSTISGSAVAAAYDFSPIRQLVDVGGGYGTLLTSLLQRFPHLSGILFDRPEVIRNAREALKTARGGAHIETIAGDFFESLPAGADAYILKYVMHDWDDEHCIHVLANCRRAMAPGGRVLIVESVLSDRPDSTLTKLLDLEMLVMTGGGRERTEPEFCSLLERAGLEFSRLLPTQSPVSVIEAFAGPDV
jgi:SAM-dependent methyltransferase